MHALEIRSFRERDRAQVVALWNRCFPGDPGRNEPNAVIDRKQRVQGDLFLVGVLGGSVVATVVAGYDGYRGWIYHLATDPDLRRRGIARRLMDAAEERLAAIGCPKVNLQVRATNAEVIAFYERIGYARESRADFGKVLEPVDAAVESGPAVGVVMYDGGIFFEIARAIEALAATRSIRIYTPDGTDHLASNGTCLRASGDYASLGVDALDAILIPGGDPGSILSPHNQVVAPLTEQAARGVVLAGICAGTLVLAASGLLRGRRGTHNYTADHAPPEVVAFAEPFWEGLRYEAADVVDDDGIITAMPWADVEFAATIAKRLEVGG